MTNQIIIRNVAAVDYDYVYTEQQVSHNGGQDWEVTAEWKHLRTDAAMKMANEWVSTPNRSIDVPPERTDI